MRDLGWRTAVVLAAVLATVLGAPTPVRLALWGAVVAVVAPRVAAARGRSGGDGVLVAAGGPLIVAALVGLVLDQLGVPLVGWSWALALGAASLVALVATSSGARRQVERPAPRPVPLATLLWSGTAALLTVLAISTALRGAEQADVAPVQMWLAGVDGVNAEVVVSSQAAAGPFELRADAGRGSTLSYPVVDVPEDGSVTTDVLLPEKGRVIITLSNPGQVTPLRVLVLDR